MVQVPGTTTVYRTWYVSSYLSAGATVLVCKVTFLYFLSIWIFYPPQCFQVRSWLLSRKRYGGTVVVVLIVTLI